MMRAKSPKTAIILLAGGAGRRLGGLDKGLLALGQGTVLDEILRRLRPQLGPDPAIAISANGDPARFAGFGLPVLADAPGEEGPLAGILRGMGFAAGLGAGRLLSLPADTPFIPDDLLAQLGPAPSYAASAGRAHPLVALWDVGGAEKLRALLHLRGERRAMAAVRELGMVAVEFADDPDPFLNINDAADLLAAQLRMNGVPGSEP